MIFRDFLRKRRFILLGNGFDNLKLTQACEGLRAEGFDDAYVLAGGIRAWAAAGRPVGGGGNVLTDEITPQQFLSGSRESDWKVIALGLDDEAVAHLPETPAGEFAVLPVVEELASYIASLRGDRSAWSLPVVLIAADEEKMQAARRAFSTSGGLPENVVWVRGGWQGYAAYIEQQHRIAVNRGRPLTRPCWAR